MENNEEQNWLERKAKNDRKEALRQTGFLGLAIVILASNIAFSIALFRKRQIFKGILLLVVVMPISLLMTMAIFRFSIWG